MVPWVVRTVRRENAVNRILVSGFCLIMALSGLPATAGEDFAVREKGGPRPEAKSDKASVYIVRSANIGRSIRIWAFADENVLGVTKSNTYLHAYLDPGTYVFWSKAENVSAVEFSVEAGKTYYFKQKVKIGMMKARVKAQFLTDAEGLKELDKCEKFSTLTDAGKTRGAEIAAEKFAVAKEKAAES